MSLPPWVRPAQGGATIEAFVRPRAAKDGLAGSTAPATGNRRLNGDVISKVRHRGMVQTSVLKVKAPPVEGKANRAVEKLFAELLGLPRGAVQVVTGELSRHKTIRVSGMSPQDVTVALDVVLSSRAHEPGEEAR